MIKGLKNKKKKGFTLIEIIAVIAIIAILAAVLIPKVTGYLREAKKTGVTDQARKVVTAAESYRIKTGTTLSDTETLANIARDSGGLIETADLNKLGTANLGDCKKIVDAEHYTFTVDDKGIFQSSASL